jgi:heme-binding protein
LKRITQNMRRILTQATITFVLVIVGIQFIPVGTKQRNGTSAGESTRLPDLADPKVNAVLDRSCGDCHSDHTRWPWYSRTAPVSWILYRDVSKGRAKLNFSQWQQKPGTTNARMEICDAVTDGEMPLHGYTLLHPDAKLSQEDIELICNWAESEVKLSKEKENHELVSQR